MAALVSVALLLLPAPATAQQAKPLPYLLDVGDLRALVRYSPGALDRASHVQFRFALLAEDFGKWSGQPVPLSVVLLSRTDWEALDLAVPYCGDYTDSNTLSGATHSGLRVVDELTRN